MNNGNFLNNKKNILESFNKKNYEKVIKLAPKFLKKNNDFQILYALSVSYLTLKKYLEAEKCFKRIILLKPTAENYYIYGNIQKQLKNYDEASKFFLEAINLKSDYSEAYNNLGNTKLKLGFIDEAVKNYIKAINANKNNLQAYFNLAHLYNEEKDFENLVKINLKSVFFIGVLQIFSLIPGVSRSGIAITAARLLEYKRIDAAKISFLVSIPILAAVSIFGIKNILFSESQYYYNLNILAILFAFLF